jgi:arsenate reductase (thioredoxin)
MRIKVFSYNLLLSILLFFLPVQIFAQAAPGTLYPILFNYAKNLYPQYKKIPEERRRVLEEIADYIYGAIQIDKEASILLIGSNNSTRSILAEAWANAAARYYNVKNVRLYSGGTQTTHVSPFALKALEKAGFIIYKVTEDNNPRYEIKYTYNTDPLIVFSKDYNDKDLPHLNYGAIFVCPNADINVPFLKGMNFRTSLHYFDPGAYDNTPSQMDKYLERSHEIATEIFYIFYCVKNKYP